MNEYLESKKEDCKICPNYSECRNGCWEEQLKICLGDK